MDVFMACSICSFLVLSSTAVRKAKRSDSKKDRTSKKNTDTEARVFFLNTARTLINLSKN